MAANVMNYRYFKLVTVDCQEISNSELSGNPRERNFLISIIITDCIPYFKYRFKLAPPLDKATPFSAQGLEIIFVGGYIPVSPQEWREYPHPRVKTSEKHHTLSLAIFCMGFLMDVRCMGVKLPHTHL